MTRNRKILAYPLDPSTLDLAARAAYDASCAVHGITGTDRDFGVAIVEWRAIAQAVATVSQPLIPSMLAGIDRSAGIPVGSDAKDRTNAIIDGQVNATIMASALKRVSASGGSNGTSGDGHQAAIERADAALRMVASGPACDQLGLRAWAGK